MRLLEDLIATDALKELTSIGAGHAATALSKLLGARRVALAVPYCTGAARIEQWMAQHDGMAVCFDLFDYEARIFVVVDAYSAQRVLDVLLREQKVDPEYMELPESALMECGNIAVSAFLDAWAEFLRLRLIPSPPRAMYGTAPSVVAYEAGSSGDALCVCSTFHIQADDIGGHLVLALSEPGAHHLLAAMGVAVTKP